MRIAFVQYGDFAEAHKRLSGGGGETYYAQKYSVDSVSRLTEKTDFIGVCSIHHGPPEDVELGSNYLASRLPPTTRGAADSQAIIAKLEAWRPTHLVVRTPLFAVIKWAIERHIKVLPIFADSWENLSIRQWIRTKRLVHLLNKPQISVVANHNVPASISLQKRGVESRKIVAWDWPHELKPNDHVTKTLGKKHCLIFIGHISEEKGAGDCVRAAKILFERKTSFELIMYGDGPLRESLQAFVKESGLTDCIKLPGKAAHDDIVQNLKDATLSLVPSRHAYAEGLPMTIYEALATRTPIIMSDHPMFLRYFKDSDAARVVPEANPKALAQAIGAMLEDTESYARASRATLELWEQICCKLPFGKLLDVWLNDPIKADDALVEFSLSKLLDDLKTSAA